MNCSRRIGVDNGASWSALNPFTLFGGSFCCDQVTQYDPVTGRQFWLLQYCPPSDPTCEGPDNHLVLANATASGTEAFTNWCSYTIPPSWYGLPDATTSVDYNEMTITNHFVNIASNLFLSGGGSATGVLRLPAATMSTCGRVNSTHVTRIDNF